LAYSATGFNLKAVFSSVALATTVNGHETAKGYALLPLTLKNSRFKAAKKRPEADNNIIYFAQHREGLENRFPKVDDILDRLSADTRTTRLWRNKAR